ncbi:uncharacterized protein TNCV_4557291 [Trichonephila clavipes]|nr:uncharacterized protein TNCV_4557291 [Trichonephila clavipes]
MTILDNSVSSKSLEPIHFTILAVANSLFLCKQDTVSNKIPPKTKTDFLKFRLEDEWSGTQSRLNEKHNSENEMNRASSSQNCVCGRENKKEMEMEIFRDENIVNPPHKYPWVTLNVVFCYCHHTLPTMWEALNTISFSIWRIMCESGHLLATALAMSSCVANGLPHRVPCNVALSDYNRHMSCLDRFDHLKGRMR